MVRLRARNERGAVTLLVAILMPVLLLGLGTIVISVGGWYAARAMDQNAADAAAVAVAHTCTAGRCDQSVAQHYADGSTNGGLAGQVSIVCGIGPLASDGSRVATNFSNCPSPLPPSSGACPPAPSNPNLGYVDVGVRPTSAAATPDLFGGGSTPVGACAQATISTAGGCSGCVAMTISQCEWNVDTNNGTSFVSAPSNHNYAVSAPFYTQPPTFYDSVTARRLDPVHYPGYLAYDPRFPLGTLQPTANSLLAGNPYYNGIWPAPSAPVGGSESVITTHGSNGSCGATGGSPGSFGWILSTSGCSANVGATYLTSTGNASQPCEAQFQASRDNETPVYIPVYSSFTMTGSGAQYTLAGFAAFVITGWNLRHGNAGGWTNAVVPSKIAQADTGLPAGADGNYCGATYSGSNSDVCIYGYFTAPLAPPGSLTGGGVPTPGSPVAYSVALTG